MFMSLLVDVPNSHHFMKMFKKQEPLSQAQVTFIQKLMSTTLHQYFCENYCQNECDHVDRLLFT